MNIYDIAEKAGVSVATVSRVINDSKSVSEKSKKKVQKVMDQEGYIPNVFARGLNLNSSKTIGILCPVISDINHVKPVSILERLLRENGFDTLLCCTNSVDENKTKYLNLLQNKRVDAIILIGSTVSEASHYAHFIPVAKEIPIVIINGMVELENVYSILCDELTALKNLVIELTKRGHTNIVYLNDTNSYSGSQKIQGYKEGLKLAGLALNEELIVQVPESEDAVVPSYQITKELISSGLPFTALIAADDILAVGAQKALLESGISMPIIGFNNSRFAQCCSPELTSIDNNMETICTTAIHILMDALKGSHPASKVLVSAHLVERETFNL